MKLLVVLDGVAEDYGRDQATTLELANIPCLDEVARYAHCGLFDPRDSFTGVVETDLVIASLLGIRPEPWPGRAYFEVKHFSDDVNGSVACAVIYFEHRGRGFRAISVPAYLEHDAALLAKVAQIYQVNLRLRDFERTMSSCLIWSETKGIDGGTVRLHKAVEALRSAVPGELRLIVKRVWGGGPVMLQRFCETPAFLAFSKGSLRGLCKTAGMDTYVDHGHVLSAADRVDAFHRVQEILAEGHYAGGVIYYKATDWASHVGSASLKRQLLEIADAWLGKLLRKLTTASNYAILIISDHRTNLRASKASATPSLFMLLRQGIQRTSRNFSERAIEEGWGRKRPYTLKELSGQFLR